VSTTTGDDHVGPGSFFSHRISPVTWCTATMRPLSVGAITTPWCSAGVAHMPWSSATDHTTGSSGLRGSSFTSCPTSVLRELLDPRSTSWAT